MAIPGTPPSVPLRGRWDPFDLPAVLILFTVGIYLATGDASVIFFTALFGVPFCGIMSQRVGLRVWSVGFLIGIGIEWGCRWYVVTRTIELNPHAKDPGQTFLFPFGFYFDTVWPSDLLSADFSSRTALQNSLKAYVAGSVVAGLVGGFISLVAWHWLGVRRAFNGLQLKWGRQPSTRKRTVRLACWLISDLVFAGMTAVWWWRSYGALPSLLFATAVFLLIAMIVLLGEKQASAQSPSQ